MIKAVKLSITLSLVITLSLNNLISRFIFLVALLLFVSGGFVVAQADPITVQARLVLGTSKEQKGKNGGSRHDSEALGQGLQMDEVL